MKKVISKIFLALTVLVAHTASAYNCYPPDNGTLSNGQTVCASTTNSSNMTVYQCNGSDGQMVNTGQKCTCNGNLLASNSGGATCQGSYSTSTTTTTTTTAAADTGKGKNR